MQILQEEFRERRKKVLNYLQDLSQKNKKNYKLVLHSGSQKTFSNDVKYPFRADSDFYYLSGFTEADAALVLDPNSENPYTLYVQAIDPEHSIWDGPRAGKEAAISVYSADAAYNYDELPSNNESDKNILDFIHSLRSIKSTAEVALMQKSIDIAVQAHRVVQENLCVGIYEYEIEAMLINVFRSQGASGWSYPPIVASGANSCILHYIQNNRKIENGDLVLIDAGAEYQYYASDLTRVHAANGSMTKEQKDIYDVVVAANQAAIATVKPGVSFAETHAEAQRVIAEGLYNLKYIKDPKNPDELKRFYMHGTGHSLGIDVHDVGIDKKSTKYIPGMVTTIEPGIYISDKAIGVRIEDNVLVTNLGHEVLSQALEKQVLS